MENATLSLINYYVLTERKHNLNYNTKIASSTDIAKFV